MYITYKNCIFYVNVKRAKKVIKQKNKIYAYYFIYIHKMELKLYKFTDKNIAKNNLIQY